ARSGIDVSSKLSQIDTRMGEIRGVIDALEPYTTAKTDDTIGWSSPTPITDGEHIWAVFSTGVVSCWTLQGKKVWSRWLGATTGHQKGYDGVPTASPVLHGGRLLVGYEQLFALDPA